MDYIIDKRMVEREIIIKFSQTGLSPDLDEMVDEIVHNLEIILFQRKFPNESTKIEVFIK